MSDSRKFLLYGILTIVITSITFGTVYAVDSISNLLGDTGFVGIGTLTPTAPLEVVGDIKLSGGLVSDGDICIGNCDVTPPVITILGDNPMDLFVGAGYTDPGAITDDGSQVTINDLAFVDAVGTYSILYDSVDSFGNQAVQVTRTVNVVEPSTTVFIQDTFDSAVTGWDYFGPLGYTITHSAEHGGSAHISGNSFGSPYLHGMQKTIDISHVGANPLFVSFDYRATSGCTCSVTTNVRIGIYDEVTGEQLYYNQPAGGGTTDTAWQSFTEDISSYVQGHDSVTVKLYLVDAWSSNWNQKNWYDNVIVSTVHPLSIQSYSSLSEGTYEDTYVEDEFDKSVNVIAEHVDEHGVDSLSDFTGTLSVSSQEIDTILNMLNVTESEDESAELYCGYPESHYDNVIYGTEAQDRLSGKRGVTNLILGYEGDDVIRGGNSNDCIYGGAGNDRILGIGGDDTIYGGPGDDFILGNSGADTITGGEDYDTCHGNAGKDVSVDCEIISKKRP